MLTLAKFYLSFSQVIYESTRNILWVRSTRETCTVMTEQLFPYHE